MVVPSIEPTEFYAGDTVKWTRRFQDFPAGDGWTLAYKFGNKERSIPVDPADITTSNDEFVIVIPAEQTAALNPAQYQLTGTVTKGTDRYVVAHGVVRVRQNPGGEGQEPFDYRTQNQRVYESICAMIEGREDVEEHTMSDGRHLRNMAMTDLLHWQQVYAGRVMKERGTLPEFIGARFQ